MRKKEPVLLVLSVCDGEIILEKGEILFEKRHFILLFLHKLFRRGLQSCTQLLSNVSQN